jgi:anti-sigma factor RsiW
VTCGELVHCLSDYIDNALAPGARAAVEEHLAACDKCHIVLDSTRCTILLSRVAASPSLARERREALLRRLEQACRRSS